MRDGIEWKEAIVAKVQCGASIRFHKIEEILASKLTTLLRSRKAIDRFDLLCSMVFAREVAVDRLQLITTFLKEINF
jgi:hypothetical protein